MCVKVPIEVDHIVAVEVCQQKKKLCFLDRKKVQKKVEKKVAGKSSKKSCENYYQFNLQLLPCHR